LEAAKNVNVATPLLARDVEWFAVPVIFGTSQLKGSTSLELLKIVLLRAAKLLPLVHHDENWQAWQQNSALSTSVIYGWIHSLNHMATQQYV
jgi:hypothetical protein